MPWLLSVIADWFVFLKSLGNLHFDKFPIALFGCPAQERPQACQEWLQASMDDGAASVGPTQTELGLWCYIACAVYVQDDDAITAVSRATYMCCRARYRRGEPLMDPDWEHVWHALWELGLRDSANPPC